jgi:ribosomal-protein-alanine N-acetyltransferase
MKNAFQRRVLFVPLGKADFQRVRAVETEGQKNPWTDSLLKEELFHRHGFHFGVRTAAAGSLAAYILCRLFAQELHIHRLCTRPALRRQGYGRALLKHALAAARSGGARVAFLEVGTSNTAAVALYKRLGFAVDAERKRYYADGNDALLMSRALY